MQLSRVFPLFSTALACAAAAPAGAATVYWNLFNIEQESALTASYVTYATRDDMLHDTNRTGVYDPNSSGFGSNVVSGGSDGKSYWNTFNIEGEHTLTATLVTYGTLLDMLLDTNRLGAFDPNSSGFGGNVVGSGASVAPIPAPPAVILLGSAIAFLGWTSRRRSRRAA